MHGFSSTRNMILPVCFCTALLLPLVFLTQPLTAVTDDSRIVRVSPKDNNSSADNTYVNLAQALETLRKITPNKPGTIIIEPGEYYLTRPLIITPRDNGLTIEAARNGSVLIYGGRRIRNWKKDGDKFYAAELPEVKAGTWDFRCLIVNNRYCPRAHLPAKGTFTHLSNFNVPWMSTTGGGWKRKPTREELTTMKFRPEDISPDLSCPNAEIRVYHMWDDSLVGVKSIDHQTGIITFSCPCGHPPGAFGVHKYEIWNIRAGMTHPGQWYLDRAAGKVVYWPLPGEDMRQIKAVAPCLESIIRVEGTRRKPVTGLTIKGLRLQATTTPLKAGGFGAGRFAGAVDISFAPGCRLFDMEISNVAGQGIKIAGGDVNIERCNVHHTGACGIRAAGCVVRDNYIHHIGLTYPSAIGITGGTNTIITHNEIHDTPYTAVNCGGANCRIEYNHIYRAMQVLHDGGGIYCFAGKNTILRGNNIHDITDTGGYGASAYYLDERSENCLVEGNLSYAVSRPSHNHMAHNNTIRNNVFIYDGDLRLTFPRCRDFLLQNNIIYAGGSISFTKVTALSLVNNIIYSGKGQIAGITLKGYSSTGSSRLSADKSNLFADPRIVAYKSGKVIFAPDSPAGKLGIQPLDVSSAGRLTKNDLPRVLIIGDSISIGYTPYVRKILQEKAIVVHNPGNGRDSTYGLASLRYWLEMDDWDIIHFNWGLWDLRYDRGKDQPPRVPLPLYEKNLRAITKLLKKTHARLIWANTTPVPVGATHRIPGSESSYNQVARRIMLEMHIPIDDLHGLILPDLDKYQIEANVHFHPGGYQRLGRQVADSILGQLETNRSRKDFSHDKMP